MNIKVLIQRSEEEFTEVGNIDITEQPTAKDLAETIKSISNDVQRDYQVSINDVYFQLKYKDDISDTCTK